MALYAEMMNATNDITASPMNLEKKDSEKIQKYFRQRG